MKSLLCGFKNCKFSLATLLLLLDPTSCLISKKFSEVSADLFVLSLSFDVRQILDFVSESLKAPENQNIITG